MHFLHRGFREALLIEILQSLVFWLPPERAAAAEGNLLYLQGWLAGRFQRETHITARNSRSAEFSHPSFPHTIGRRDKMLFCS